MTKKPLILEIKGNSLDDGPGIRSVVFFKGCPLTCAWCHNPESKRATPEISFEPKVCIGCNTCIETCTREALSRQNPFFIDRTTCDLCFDCVKNCPAEALEQLGKEMPIDQLVKTVVRDKPFFDTSNGGVTLSGGEPAIRIDYLGETAKAFKEKGVHVLVETCGQFNFQRFNERVYPHVDLIYFDIKLIDSHSHEKYCGISNRVILQNFIKLHESYLMGGTEILPRTPLVPNITDTKENLEAIVSFYREHKVQRTQLLAYHPLWQEKNLKIGVSPLSTFKGEMGDWMSNERVRACEKIFLDAGIAVEK